MKKFTIEDKKKIAHGRNIDKLKQIVKDKELMIKKLENEIEDIQNLIKHNEYLDQF